MASMVYILKSEQNGRYYVGSTGDVAKRLANHNSGGTPSARPHRPWKLVYVEEHGTPEEERRRERAIKRQKSRRYIERMIRWAGPVDGRGRAV